jgi:hypothetical protein
MKQLYNGFAEVSSGNLSQVWNLSSHGDEQIERKQVSRKSDRSAFSSVSADWRMSTGISHRNK